MLSSTLCMRIHLPPTFTCSYLPISLSSLPPASLFTLHRHLFRNMLLPQHQGGKSLECVAGNQKTLRSPHRLQYTTAQAHSHCWFCAQRQCSIHTHSPKKLQPETICIPLFDSHLKPHWPLLIECRKQVCGSRQRAGSEERRSMQRSLVTQHF